MNYESIVTVSSEARPGVELRVARMSFGRRMELMKRVRELAHRVEYLEGGTDAREHMDAGLLRAEIDKLFVLWGVAEVSGLMVDGEAATPSVLADRGPEDVFGEALAAVRREVGLTDEERKN